MRSISATLAVGGRCAHSRGKRLRHQSSRCRSECSDEVQLCTMSAASCSLGLRRIGAKQTAEGEWNAPIEHKETLQCSGIPNFVYLYQYIAGNLRCWLSEQRQHHSGGHLVLGTRCQWDGLPGSPQFPLERIRKAALEASQLERDGHNLHRKGSRVGDCGSTSVYVCCEKHAPAKHASQQ